jgi:beta-lactamase class A
MQKCLVFVSLALCELITLPAANAAPLAQTVAAATPLDMRVSQLVALLKGDIAVEAFFDPSFLTAVPATQFKTITDSLIAQYGLPLKITSVNKKGESAATLKLVFEKAVGSVEIAVAAQAPNKVIGLLFTGFAVENDSLINIDAEFAALPGRAGYVVEKIDAEGKRTVIAARNANAQFAIGSTFKLYILAELAAQVDAGKRKWADVIPLTRRSFSSAATQNLPLGTPVTLQLLATWMIMVSDNAATDELILLLGRDKIEARLRSIGHSNPERMLPFLTTAEAFLLKSDYNGTRAKYIKGSEAQQRTLIENDISKTNFDKIDTSKFTGQPLSIDSIEWFASPNDIVLLMDHIRRMNNQIALKIMAQGVSSAIAQKWHYLGSKGGSEPGVISASFLGQRRSGGWIVVSGSWNDTAKVVDDAKFFALVQRLLDAVAE